MYRAKFIVQTRTELMDGPVMVNLQPVNDGDENSKEFWANGSTGSITLTLNTVELQAEFQVGSYVYAGFEAAVGAAVPKTTVTLEAIGLAEEIKR